MATQITIKDEINYKVPPVPRDMVIQYLRDHGWKLFNTVSGQYEEWYISSQFAPSGKPGEVRVYFEEHGWYLIHLELIFGGIAKQENRLPTDVYADMVGFEIPGTFAAYRDQMIRLMNLLKSSAEVLSNFDVGFSDMMNSYLDDVRETFNDVPCGDEK